ITHPAHLRSHLEQAHTAHRAKLREQVYRHALIDQPLPVALEQKAHPTSTRRESPAVRLGAGTECLAIGRFAQTVQQPADFVRVDVVGFHRVQGKAVTPVRSPQSRAGRSLRARLLPYALAAAPAPRRSQVRSTSAPPPHAAPRPVLNSHPPVFRPWCPRSQVLRPRPRDRTPRRRPYESPRPPAR